MVMVVIVAAICSAAIGKPIVRISETTVVSDWAIVEVVGVVDADPVAHCVQIWKVDICWQLLLLLFVNGSKNTLLHISRLSAVVVRRCGLSLVVVHLVIGQAEVAAADATDAFAGGGGRGFAILLLHNRLLNDPSVVLLRGLYLRRLNRAEVLHRLGR